MAAARAAEREGWHYADPNDRRRTGGRKTRIPQLPEAPPGALLLDDLAAFLRRFVAYPSEEALEAHALWIVHAHAMDAWYSTPRIAFLSTEPGSGKTRALEVTELLVPSPVQAVNVSAAHLFRKVGASSGPPTLLYDEIDTVFGPKAKDNEDIRALLNAGHRRGAVAGRCAVRGNNVVTEEIPAYWPSRLQALGIFPTRSCRGRSSFACAAGSPMSALSHSVAASTSRKELRFLIASRTGSPTLPGRWLTPSRACRPVSMTEMPTCGSR